MTLNAVLPTKATQAVTIAAAVTGNPKKVRTTTTEAVAPIEAHTTKRHLTEATPSGRGILEDTYWNTNF
jgi:hypothetical protein